MAGVAEHYDYLVARVWFHGMTASDLETVANYKPGKTFDDFKNAIWGAGKDPRDETPIIDQAITRVAGVVDLDLSLSVKDYSKRLEGLTHVPPCRHPLPESIP